ncbi:hypothetical protein PHET_11754 [Paragonimus heterotremus]|uniref:Uncharacterized protein n=1 Tax=Paragonimus heterotremus TaxID=100268 RepID=A0A8J4SJY2_9TREM|nr:hypothetical protein PHET_11754 [Paragonimus heterotremus]
MQQSYGGIRSHVGLSKRRRRVHHVEFNDEKLAQRPQPQYKWSYLENAMLKNMATNLFRPSETQKELYTEMTPVFPNKSSEAIRNVSNTCPGIHLNSQHCKLATLPSRHNPAFR